MPQASQESDTGERLPHLTKGFKEGFRMPAPTHQVPYSVKSLETSTLISFDGVQEID